MPLRIPIFIVVYNRLWCLKRCIASLVPSGQEIVLINNGSDYKPLLAWMRNHPYPVIHLPKIRSTGELYRSIRRGISQWLAKPKFKKHPIDGYVLTDPDIEIEHPRGPWLSLMHKCLKAHPQAQCVGSALRTDDIPAHYPLRASAIAWEQWCKKKPIFEWEGVPIRWSHIDTTLALYRPKFIKHGVAMRAIRMRGPGMARHLDWYINPKHMTPDQRVYLSAPRKLTHFGGMSLRDKLRGAKRPRAKTDVKAKVKAVRAKVRATKVNTGVRAKVRATKVKTGVRAKVKAGVRTGVRAGVRTDVRATKVKPEVTRGQHTGEKRKRKMRGVMARLQLDVMKKQKK